MKKLQITSEHYKALLAAYNNWLQTLDYAAKTQTTWTNHVQEHLHWLEQNQILHVTNILPHHGEKYRYYLETRKNQTQTGGLSTHAINKMHNALNGFSKYLTHTSKYQLNLPYYPIKQATSKREILTIEEIKALHEATYQSYRNNNIAFGQRNRAMLAIYYSCGLRLSVKVSPSTPKTFISKKNTSM